MHNSIPMCKIGSPEKYSLLLLGIIEVGVEFLLGFGFLSLSECYINASNIGVIRSTKNLALTFL